MNERLYPLFLKKSALGFTKKYSGITFPAQAANVYNVQLLNRIWPKIEIILLKNQNDNRKNRCTASQIQTINQIIEGVRAKNLGTTILFVHFSKSFDSTEERWNIYNLHIDYLKKKTVAARMMLSKNTKEMVRSLDGDTDVFDIITGVLQGDTLVPYLFILCQDDVLQISINLIKIDFILKRQEADDISQTL